MERRSFGRWTLVFLAMLLVVTATGQATPYEQKARRFVCNFPPGDDYPLTCHLFTSGLEDLRGRGKKFVGFGMGLVGFTGDPRDPWDYLSSIGLEIKQKYNARRMRSVYRIRPWPGAERLVRGKIVTMGSAPERVYKAKLSYYHMGGVRSHRIKDASQVRLDFENWGPKPSATWPAHEETDVPADTFVTVLFNEPIDPASVTNDTLTILGEPQGTVSVTSEKQIRLAPARKLTRTQGQYAVVLSAGKVKDPEGNAIQYDYQWWFSSRGY